MSASNRGHDAAMCGIFYHTRLYTEGNHEMRQLPQNNPTIRSVVCRLWRMARPSKPGPVGSHSKGRLYTEGVVVLAGSIAVVVLIARVVN